MAGIYKTFGCEPPRLLGMNTNLPAATGPNTDNGLPKGYSTITPFLALQEPSAALDFCQEVFGVRLVHCMTYENVVVHAEIEFEHGRLQLGAENRECHLTPIDIDDKEVSFSLGFYCADADSVVERALAHGATLREPFITFASGDRFGSIKDPFGPLDDHDLG